MGLDEIKVYTVVIDEVSGECEVSYPLSEDMSEFELIKVLKSVIDECYLDLRNTYYHERSENDGY